MGPRITKDENGNKRTELTCCEGFTEADQFVDSEVDLVKRFGTNKFQEVVQQYKPISDGLDSMNIGQLKELAEAEEVDLPNNARKEDIIQAIRSAGTTTAVV